MAKRRIKKRRPDFRRIRPTKTYTVTEIAKALDRSPATVRSWIRDGLPTIDDHNPPFVQGSALKTWLKAKWAARKRSCLPDEIYCFKCRRPRTTRPGSVRVALRNQKTASITAECHVCGTLMTQACSLTTKAEIEADRHPLSTHLQHLFGCSKASVKPTDGDHCLAANKSGADQRHLTPSGQQSTNGNQR